MDLQTYKIALGKLTRTNTPYKTYRLTDLRTYRMSDTLIDTVREFIALRQGRTIDISYVRNELKIDPNSKAWEGLYTVLSRLVQERKLRPSGKKDGVYSVVTQIEPVRVFIPGRERRPLFDLVFPRVFDTMAEMDFAKYVCIREGDLLTFGGVKSKGKTTLCLNICGENIDKKPVLMGNEYTVLVNDKFEPAPRFLNRLDTMAEWVDWTDENGYDKFTLLPIRNDYAEHIVSDRINIIDWINLDGGELYDIGKVLEGIKANLGRGIAIVALQKGEGATNPRGGQFVRDFSDVELLLDGFGGSEDDILLTIKGVKEKTAPIVGKTYAYSITGNGTKIVNFREVKKCSDCRGVGYKVGKECEQCSGHKFVNK